MTIIPGEIYCLKVTGEKVFVLSNDSEESVRVRHPEISDTGRIIHTIESFSACELETLEEHAERQVQEVLLKNKTSNRLNKLMELDNNSASGEVKSAEPKVN